MSILHVCNTFFEWELAGEISSLKTGFSLNKNVRQLQFLPLVYGEGPIVVTGFPEEKLDRPLFLLDDLPKGAKLDVWGHSKLLQEWAKNKGLLYEMPPWNVVKKVNAKSYSFEKSPLPGAKLLWPGDRLRKNCLVKSLYGTAGKGAARSETASKLCEKEWAQGHPVLEEPLVKRTVDFSSQWEILPSGDCVFFGVTFCRVSKWGAHLANLVGDEPRWQNFVDEHLAFVPPVLSEMAEMGFFGNVGFDAMVYEGGFQPIVEINARKTMGYVALAFQKLYAPGKRLELSYYESKKEGLLPKKGFPKQLISTIYEA